MKLRFTERAAFELDEILTYIDSQSPQGAVRVKRRLQMVIDTLLRHPEAGRKTGRAGLRRIVVQPYPYLVFYQPGADEVVIHGLRYGARRPF